MAVNNYILLEDGSGHLILELVGAFLNENSIGISALIVGGLAIVPKRVVLSLNVVMKQTIGNLAVVA